MAIFMLILFQINSVLMIAFYTKYTGENVVQSIEELQLDFTTLNDEIVENLSLNSNDSTYIDNFLKTFSREHQMTVTIFDQNGKKLYDYNHLNGLIGYNSKDFVISSGQVKYVIEAEYKIDLLKIKESGAFKGIRNFSFLIIAISFIITILYFYQQVAKPLKHINQQIDKVNGRSEVLSFDYKANDELGDLCRNFEHLEKRLIKAHEEQTESLEALNHDLRTPLTTIVGYLEKLMKNDKLADEKRQKYISVIDRKVNDLTLLVDDISKTQFSHIEINKNPIHVYDFFSDLCEIYAAELSIRNVQFKANIAVTKDLIMDLDTDKIMRVFSNLIDNSLKYAGENVVISLSLYFTNQELNIDFSDDGIGVSDDELEFVFDRFWRAEKSRSKNLGGSGLGLSICQSIVLAMDGTIKAYIPLSEGFGVHIELPQ